MAVEFKQELHDFDVIGLPCARCIDSYPVWKCLGTAKSVLLSYKI